MNWLVYGIVATLVRFIQTLPLTWAARLGRAGGAAAFWLDGRHRRVALQNMTAALGSERTPAEIQALARENFRRIGENYCCAVKTATMTYEQLRGRVEFTGLDKFLQGTAPDHPQSLIVAIGHFGNFELYGLCGQIMPQFQGATTYRSVGHPSLDRILLGMRIQSGTLYFERRKDAAALKAAFRPHGFMLGLLSDQNAGPGGLRLPFLGRECSTSAAPALFALRYNCRLFTGVCYRIGLGRWRIDAGDEIPTHAAGAPRPVEAMMREVNAAFERAVRRDPANWFWVHNRWKQRDFNAKSRRRHTDAEPAPPGPTPVEGG